VGSKTISGTQFQGIILPEVVNYARSYFNDPNLDMVPLEDEGGGGSAGSHWDKVFLTMEYMNPTIESPGILSEFTMTFLRATGWYTIDAGAAQPYDWGKDDGPDHFQICP
jgi:leishmanolysin